MMVRYTFYVTIEDRDQESVGGGSSSLRERCGRLDGAAMRGQPGMCDTNHHASTFEIQ